jgi:hypothetical protein
MMLVFMLVYVLVVGYVEVGHGIYLPGVRSTLRSLKDF